MSSRASRSAAALSRVRAASSDFDFLGGGGKLGALIRSYDWSATRLGPLESWPQSLKTATTILLRSPVPIALLWGADGIMIYNDAYAVFSAARHPALLGSRVLEGWPEVADFNAEVMRVGLSGGTLSYRDRHLVLHRHGHAEDVWLNLDYSPVLDESARPAGVLAIVVETTDRVVSERRLRTLREIALRMSPANSVQAVFETAAEVLATENPADLPCVFLYRLQAAGRLELLGHCGARPRDSARSVDMTASDGGLAGLFTRWRADELTEIPAELLLEPGTADGAAIHRLALLPITSGDSLVGALAVGMRQREAAHPYGTAQLHEFIALVASQISKRAAAALALEEEHRRLAALAELDRAKTTFFSNVSHELRTPLTLMLGPLEEAANNLATPASVQSQLSLAHRNTLRLLRLVNSLLDFARIEAGRMQACYEPTALAALTRELASNFRSAMDRAGLTFIVECEDLDEPVYVDWDMWEKIVLNLLSNALKFTLHGWVAVRLKRDGEQALLEVSDTGVGIPEEELPRLFERFHRARGTAGRSQEGTGIGLALAQELVKLHGGAIDIESVVQSGTRVRIRIPFGRTHLPDAQLRPARSLLLTSTGAQPYIQEAWSWLPDEADNNASPSSLAQAPLPFPESIPASSRQRIVLADDNADMRTYVQDLLSPWYEVETVANGEEALAAIQRLRPDLVISDVMMPRLDGYGLLKALRADARLRMIPFLLLSARAGEEARIEGLQAGADDYLVKPFASRELLVRIQTTLSLASVRGEFERRLAADLAAMTSLHALAETFGEHGEDFDRCMYAVLDAAIAISGAAKGNLQVVERRSGTLKIVAQRGFEPPFLEYFAVVRADESSACASALRQGRRTVVGDVTHSELFADTTAIGVLLEAGVHAVQSTPLVSSSSGEILGILSTHFAAPHTPSERELEVLDILGRQTADYLEHRAADAAIRASERRFRTVLDASPAALALASPIRDPSNAIVDFRLTYLNKPAQDIVCKSVGALPEGMVGRSLLEVLPGHWGAPDLFEHLVRAVQTSSVQSVEAQSLATGARQSYLHLIAPFEEGVLVWFVDLTAQKQAEQQLREQDRRKDEFLAMLAHELRNPLAPISNTSELLARTLPNDGRNRALSRILQRQVKQITRLVDDLLDVSRITQGRIELKRRPVQLTEVIGQAVESVEPMIKEKSHNISVTTHQSLRVSADPVRLLQCIVNLLTNAAKYSEPGGQIRVESLQDEGEAVLTVTDNGHGISAALLPHVFELFVQGDRAADRAQGGLGIGLSVVKRLIDMHGGKVSAFSAGPGQGSRFEIRLPLVEAEAGIAPSEAQPAAGPLCILVVDDNVDAAQSIGMILELWGHRMECAYSARDALTRIQALKPDLCLLDIGLPQMDGYEVARTIRADPGLKDIRLIALTGYGQAEDRQRAKAAGFDDHLTKPADFQALQRIIANLPARDAGS